MAGRGNINISVSTPTTPMSGPDIAEPARDPFPAICGVDAMRGHLSAAGIPDDIASLRPQFADRLWQHMNRHGDPGLHGVNPVEWTALSSQR